MRNKMLAVLATIAVAFVLGVPLAHADNFDFGAVGGVVGASGNALTTTTCSTVNSVSINGTNYVQSNAGTVCFTTGDLLSGSFGTGGTFDAGGSFTITLTSGLGGLATGTVFQGSFLDGNLTAPSAGFQSFSGGLTGTWYGSGSYSGGTSVLQFSWNSGSQSAGISSLDAGFQVPEPASLTLFGVGLLGLAGFLRRKLFFA